VLNIFKKALLLLGLAAGGAQAAELLDEAAFTRVVADRIESLGLGIKPTVTGPLTVELEGNDKTATMNLDNAYADYKSSPENLDAVAAGFVDTAKSIFSPAPANRAETLLPVVRDVEFINFMQTAVRDKSEGAHKGDELAVVTLYGDVGLLFAFDSETMVQFATWQEIEGLGIKREDAKALALKNFERSLPMPDVVEFEGFWGLEFGGSYQSSLLLSDTYWQSRSFPFKGDLVAFPASREAMFLTGSGEEKLADVRATAKKWMDEHSYPLSAQPLVRRDGKWSVFEE
jgi:hypothetical protein